MADTPKDGETGAPKAPENNANPQGTPPAAPAAPVKTEDNSAVEQLKKELAQAQMRANQLENEKKQRDEAEASRKAKELEEQNQFKDLYEQEKTKREAIEAEREEAERKAELTKTKTEVLAEYGEDVKAAAEDLGLDLADTDDSSVTAFKEKLDKLKTRVASTGTPGPNNPPKPNSNQPKLSGDELREKLRSEDGFHEVVTSQFPGIAVMAGEKPKPQE